MDKGLNFIDTAEEYGKGHSEEIIAKAVDGNRDKMVIATKFKHQNATPERLRLALERSLRNLKTDYIDLYIYHWPNRHEPLENTIAAMEAFRQEGKIRAIGVSNWMQPEWEEFDDAGRIDCLQPCHSLLWRSIESDVLPMCAANDISVTPYLPLCQGVLAGRFRTMADVPKRDPRLHNLVWREEQLPSVLAVVAKLEEIGRSYGKSIAQTAIRWLLDQPGVSAPIVGASSPEQMDDNIGALDWSLDDADWQILSEISAPVSEGLTHKDTLWGWHPKYR